MSARLPWGFQSLFSACLGRAACLCCSQAGPALAQQPQPQHQGQAAGLMPATLLQLLTNPVTLQQVR